MIQAVKSCFRNYFDFSGRASRREFWYFVLFMAILSTIIQTYLESGLGHFTLSFGLHLSLGTENHWLENLFTLVFLVPFLSSLVRRLHDMGRSGYLVLAWLAILAASIASFWFLPWGFGVVGILASLMLAVFFLASPSVPGPNEYGPNPNEVSP